VSEDSARALFLRGKCVHLSLSCSFTRVLFRCAIHSACVRCGCIAGGGAQSVLIAELWLWLVPSAELVGSAESCARMQLMTVCEPWIWIT
jgi:hypothetical protein